MLWILLILPAIILARHPSLNPVVVVTKGGCGHHYVCKPASQCSVWYDELRTQSSKPCTDARGYVGLPSAAPILFKRNVSCYIYFD